jgi:hypothetical protein
LEEKCHCTTSIVPVENTVIPAVHDNHGAGVAVSLDITLRSNLIRNTLDLQNYFDDDILAGLDEDRFASVGRGRRGSNS